MTGVDAQSRAHYASSLPNSDWRDHRDRDAALSVDTLRSDGTGAVVRVSGELDMATAAPLWAVLQSHLAAGRRFLRLDLSAVTFIDASALTAIARVHGEALSLRGTLVITGVRAATARVMQMTGLDQVLFLSGPRAAVVDEPPLDGDLLYPALDVDSGRTTWTAAS